MEIGENDGPDSTDDKKSEEPKPSVRTRCFRWFFLFAVGWCLGNWFLEPMTEPVAISWLYPRIAPRSQNDTVRFVDLQPLYERDASDVSGGRLPSAAFQEFLDAVRKLDAEHRPTAIGFDIPLFQDALLRQGGGIRWTTDRKEVLRKMIAFSEETEIPVRVGIPSFRLDLRGLKKDFPHLSRSIATTMVYRSNSNVAPIWFGRGTKDDTIGGLGFSVATDYLKEENIELGRSALEPRHHIKAPGGWPSDVQPAEWIYVDYSLLRQREERTVHFGSNVSSEGQPSAADFTAEDLKRLVHPGNHGTLWIVGVTEVPESEDTFVYDSHSQWIGEGEPVRRIYQHGAIANTYLAAPLTRLSWLGALLIDVLSSLSGLVAVLLLDKRFQDVPNKRNVLKVFLRAWGWIVLCLPYWLAKLLRSIAAHRKSKPHGNQEDELVRILVVPLLIALPFLLSFILALNFRIFWFGFVGAATYALIEPILDGTLENI